MGLRSSVWTGAPPISRPSPVCFRPTRASSTRLRSGVVMAPRRAFFRQRKGVPVVVVRRRRSRRLGLVQRRPAPDVHMDAVVRRRARRAERVRSVVLDTISWRPSRRTVGRVALWPSPRPPVDGLWGYGAGVRAQVHAVRALRTVAAVASAFQDPAAERGHLCADERDRVPKSRWSRRSRRGSRSGTTTLERRGGVNTPNFWEHVSVPRVDWAYLVTGLTGGFGVGRAVALLSGAVAGLFLCLVCLFLLQRPSVVDSCRIMLSGTCLTLLVVYHHHYDLAS